MDALDNLGDTGLDAGLITEISDVLTGLANDDTGLLGRDEGTEGEGGVSIGSLAILVFEIMVVLGLVQGVVAGGSGEVVRILGKRPG